MYGKATHAYQAQQVRGVSKVRQVAMLYDRAVASLREAVQAIEDNQIEKRWRANKRAQDIIFALYGALDDDQGGEVARNLSNLYMFCLQRLPQVDLKNDPAPANEAIEILDPLRKSWHELARREATGTLTDAEGEAAVSSAMERGAASAAASTGRSYDIAG